MWQIDGFCDKSEVGLILCLIEFEIGVITKKAPVKGPNLVLCSLP